MLACKAMPSMVPMKSAMSRATSPLAPHRVGRPPQLHDGGTKRVAGAGQRALHVADLVLAIDHRRHVQVAIARPGGHLGHAPESRAHRAHQQTGRQAHCHPDRQAHAAHALPDQADPDPGRPPVLQGQAPVLPHTEGSQGRPHALGTLPLGCGQLGVGAGLQAGVPRAAVGATGLGQGAPLRGLDDARLRFVPPRRRGLGPSADSVGCHRGQAGDQAADPEGSPREGSPHPGVAICTFAQSGRTRILTDTARMQKAQQALQADRDQREEKAHRHAGTDRHALASGQRPRQPGLQGERHVADPVEDRHAHPGHEQAARPALPTWTRRPPRADLGLYIALN